MSRLWRAQTLPKLSRHWQAVKRLNLALEGRRKPELKPLTQPDPLEALSQALHDWTQGTFLDDCNLTP